VRLLGELLRRQLVPGGGDVEAVERRPAEGAAGRTLDRQIDDREQTAVGRMAANLASLPHRDPHAAVGVDRQPVRRAGRVRELDQRAAPAKLTTLAVERESVDAPFGGVDVVAPAPARIPVDAVGDADPGKHGLHGPVRLEPIQRARAPSHVVRHAARPETALGIHAAVVHAHIGRVGQRSGEHRLVAVVAQRREPLTHCGDEPTAGARRDRPDVATDDALARVVVLRRPREHAPGHEVDPQQPANLAVPDRALAVMRERQVERVRGQGHGHVAAR